MTKPEGGPPTIAVTNVPNVPPASVPMILIRMDVLRLVRDWLTWMQGELVAGRIVREVHFPAGAPPDYLNTMTEALAELVIHAGHAIESSPLVFFRTVVQAADVALVMPPRMPGEIGS